MATRLKFKSQAFVRSTFHRFYIERVFDHPAFFACNFSGEDRSNRYLVVLRDVDVEMGNQRLYHRSIVGIFVRGRPAPIRGIRTVSSVDSINFDSCGVAEESLIPIGKPDHLLPP